MTRSLFALVVLGLSAGHAALVRRHARYYFVLGDRARVVAGRVFARFAPRQSRVFAINSSTGPARVMSSPRSFVYRVSAAPQATMRTLSHRGVRQSMRESPRTKLLARRER